jgi:hypothetical protein
VESAVIRVAFADAEQERKRRRDLRAQDPLALCHLPHRRHRMRAAFEVEVRVRAVVRAPELAHAPEVVAVEVGVAAVQQREGAEVAAQKVAHRRTALSLSP